MHTQQKSFLSTLLFSALTLITGHNLNAMTLNVKNTTTNAINVDVSGDRETRVLAQATVLPGKITYIPLSGGVRTINTISIDGELVTTGHELFSRPHGMSEITCLDIEVSPTKYIFSTCAGLKQIWEKQRFR